MFGFPFFGPIGNHEILGSNAMAAAQAQERESRFWSHVWGTAPSIRQLLAMTNWQPPISKEALDKRYSKFCEDLEAFKASH